MIRYKSWVDKDTSWEQVSNIIYNLVLSHLPKVLELLLKSQTKWDKVLSEIDGVGILLMLRNITHKYDRSVQSTLSYVKKFFGVDIGIPR